MDLKEQIRQELEKNKKRSMPEKNHNQNMVI